MVYELETPGLDSSPFYRRQIGSSGSWFDNSGWQRLRVLLPPGTSLMKVPELILPPMLIRRCTGRK